MSNYKKYILKDGQTRWGVHAYLGTDELTGKQVYYKKQGFKRQKEARTAYLNARAEFQKGLYHNSNTGNLKLKDVYQEWFEQYRLSVRDSTANKTKEYFDLHILPVFGDKRINKITSRQLQSFLNDLHKRFVIYKRIYNYLINVLDYALLQGYITNNPKDKVIAPKHSKVQPPKKKTKDFYSKDELKDFMNAISQENSLKWPAFFRLLAFTGIRRGEALALTWNDINFKEATLKVNKALALGLNNKQLIQPPKNEQSNRTIPIDHTTLKLLNDWKAEQAELLIGFGFNAINPKQLLFSKHSTNKPLDLSTPRNNLSRLCKKYNLEMINIHGFRHTHCSLLLEAGFPIREVMDRLGHSDIQTTMNIYAKVTPESKDELAEKFAQFVSF